MIYCWLLSIQYRYVMHIKDDKRLFYVLNPWESSSVPSNPYNIVVLLVTTEMNHRTVLVYGIIFNSIQNWNDFVLIFFRTEIIVSTLEETSYK